MREIRAKDLAPGDMYVLNDQVFVVDRVEIKRVGGLNKVVAHDHNMSNIKGFHVFGPTVTVVIA